jgi:phenylacetate-CoA ligase
VGAWGFGTVDGKGLHVIESEFIAELLVFSDAEPHGRTANEGELSELVITGLGRYGAPAIRYRTGDLVRGRRDDTLGNRFLVLDGGIIGRADNMVVVRGVNIFPSSIEAVVRHVAGNTEYRVIQSQVDAMTQLRVEIEVGQTGFTNASELTAKLTAALREQLGLRIDVRSLPTGTLPRSEGKSKRWFVENGSRAS